jgi:hypothetical protein
MERDPGLQRAAALVMLLVLILGAGASASSSATTTITGTILPKNPITVAFTGTPLSGCAPLKVRFTWSPWGVLRGQETARGTRPTPSNAPVSTM